MHKKAYVTSALAGVPALAAGLAWAAEAGGARQAQEQEQIYGSR